MKKIRIRAKIKGEEEFFAATVRGWERMTGHVIEAGIAGSRDRFYSFLVFTEKTGPLSMALVAAVSGCKMASADFETYEEAMQSREEFVLRTLEDHILGSAGDILRLNQHHAKRAAELYLTIGLPGQEKKGDQAHE